MQLTDEELERLLDAAAHRGACQALSQLGLTPEAKEDLKEMRDLVSAWRATRQEIGRTAIRILTTAVIMFMAAAIWMNFKAKL